MRLCGLFAIVMAFVVAETAIAQDVLRTLTPGVRIITEHQRAASAWEAPPWSAPVRLQIQSAVFHSMEAPRFGAIARQGQAMPVGEAGTLGDMFNPATLDSIGRGAFVAMVDGATRNQGIFFADATRLKVVVMGCGATGGGGSSAGCGDPSPIGGTFSGMFQGTTPAPAANDAGDILFLADLAGAAAPRGLFLYQATDEQIIKIAAVGDPSPRGGILTAVGPGAINNLGTIVFPASSFGDGSQGSDILLWQEGVLTTYVAAGDSTAEGEVFSYVGGEAFGYPDGTWIPTSVPAINDSNQVAFSGGTQTGGGLFLSSDGVHERQVRWDDTAPGGGVFFDFRGDPVLNGRGEIAFLAYTSESATNPPTGGGWFVGFRGNFRGALRFSDPLEQGAVNGLAFSRNPFRPLDDAGNLVLWARYQLADKSEHEALLVVRPGETPTALVSQGAPSPLGGSWGSLNAWPTSNNAYQVQFTAGTPGYLDSTHGQFVATYQPDVVFSDDFEGPAQNP